MNKKIIILVMLCIAIMLFSQQILAGYAEDVVYKEYQLQKDYGFGWEDYMSFDYVYKTISYQNGYEVKSTSVYYTEPEVINTWPTYYAKRYKVTVYSYRTW